MRTLQLERISTIWFLTLGVTSLAAGILVYILLLESALGAFSIREASPTQIGVDTRPRIALLNSEYTKEAHKILNLRDTSTAWVDQTLISWREFFINQKPLIPFTDISDDDLEYGDLSEYQVLVLPSVRAMSDLQIQRVQEFMQNGGSVMATWTPGIYRPDGSWRGWSFMEETFGVEFEDFVERGQGNFRVYADTFPGQMLDGIYLPRYLTESDRFIPPSTGDEGHEAFRANQQRRASEMDFPPLQDYVWFDTLNSAQPTVDWARARQIRAEIRDLDGSLREQDAVVVSYFTWTGRDLGDDIPFPRTSGGIRRLTLRAGTPISADIPPGYRVKIQVYNPGVKVRVVDEDRAKAAAFWFDFATEDLVSQDQLTESSGIVYGNYGAGRFVYMGFQRNAMGVGPDDAEDWEILQYYFRNTMNYLRRLPTIWVHDWPYNYTAAAMVTGAAESSEGIGRFASFADMLDRQDVPGTWLVKPEQAAPHTSLLRRLHRTGDVAVYDTLRVEADGLPENQAVRLQRMRDMLESIVDGRVQGYRSTERGILGRNTMGGLTRAGYTYFMPDSIGRRIAPKIMGFPYETLTRIGTTIKGEQDVLRDLDESGRDLLTGLMLEDVNRIQYEGGLYNLVYNPETIGSGTLNTLVSTLKDGDFWIAPGDSIALWWRLKKGLNADVEQRSPSRIFVRVSNDNGHTAKEATVSISLGRSVTAVNVRPELINIFRPVPDEVDIPPYRLRENGTILELSIRELKPQQYRIFHVDLLDERFALHDQNRNSDEGGGE
ncbi:MAG: hypothetical protein RIE53_07865 [Rhodothermales bacterium]